MPQRADLFTYLLNQLRYGAAVDELNDAVAKAVIAAQDTNKVASVTLKISINPRGIASGQYLITDDISTKLPELPVESTLMFGTPDGNLQREDPRQRSLELTAVTTPKVEVVSVEETKPELVKVPSAS